MTLIDFYKQVIENVGLHVDDEGYIYHSDSNGKVIVTADGKSMVLPTRDQLNSVYDKDEDGKIIITKLPYNPLNEDVIKGDSLSLKKTKIFVERRLSFIIYGVGTLLLTVASNKELQKNTNIDTNKFLAAINEAQNQGIKQLVDEKTLKLWDQLFVNTLKDKTGMFSIYLKKSGIYNGDKYNRLATLSSPLYDALLAAGKEEAIYDVKLRNKDLTIFKLLFKHILNMMDDNNVVSVGSNDVESPAFISLFKLYLKIVHRTNKMLDHLKNVNEEYYDSCYIKNMININDLDSLDTFKNELMKLPNENDLTREMAKSTKTSKPIEIPGSVYTNNTPQQVSQPYPTQPVSLQQANTMKQAEAQEEVDPVRLALYGRHGEKMNHNVGVNNYGAMAPMGYNGIPTPVVNPVPNTPGGFYNQPNKLGYPVGLPQTPIPSPMPNPNMMYPNNMMGYPNFGNNGIGYPMGVPNGIYR